MKKRLFAILILALAMILAFTGCEFLENLIQDVPHKHVVCADENKDHKCDVCGAEMGTHEAADGKHTCDYCGAEVTTCADENKDHKCDVCGTTLSACSDKDDHKCDLCGKVISECVDANTDYVCDICGKELERPPVGNTTIVLDPESEHATPVQGPQTVRAGEFEIILSSEKSRIEAKNVTFTLEDGSSSNQNYRINFNGSETIYDPETGTWQNAIWFMTSGKGKVTIYWQHGGKGSEGDTSSKAYRNVALWNAAGEMLAKTESEYYYEELIVTTFEFDAAGTYYIGNLAGANNFFYVEVSYEGEKVSLPALPKYTVHFSTGEGSAVADAEVEKGATVVKPEDPTRDGFEFGGWYKDEACTTPWNFSTDRISEETTLYAKWESVYVGEYEDVHYELNISGLETGSRSEDEINGRFTIVSGTEVRNRTRTYDGVEYTKSVKIGGSSHMIKVSVPGDGTLKFIIQNGSSGADVQYTKVIAPDGTVYDIEFAGNNEGSPLVMLELAVTEGEWTICRGKNGGTQDIYFLSLDCSVPVSPETGFELVDPGKVDYVAGEDLDLSKLVLNATFESGKTEPLALADVTVDVSAFNKDVAGKYTITVSYKEYAPITYEVSVFAPSSLELDFDAIEKLAQNSSAGNGVYFNHSFKEVYALNEELATAGLSVTVVATNGETEKSFRVALTQVTITGFDPAVIGKQTLTITYGAVSATVDVYVVDTAPSKVGDTYQAKVEKSYTGAIGAVVDGYNMFTTVEQALNFLARVDANEKKLIVIGEGLFTEKLEITIPNLTIRGAGKDKTTIEWDSLYGLVDAGGFTHTTDSTQTVAVRDNATNVTIEGLTISNYWNSQDRMDAASLGIERGLALLVQADRFIMKDSALLGIQDTLELFTGRQYFENVFISGYTDFIFGTNNTTYFKNCTIHVIDTSKDDAGTAGYLTAFKGSNKGATDAIVYGAIFDGCKFTADEGVMEGKTAIGRTWGAYAAVAVINSEIGGHISLDGYDSANNKNKRYISMNGIHPTDATVQFVEYNNTGAGAITEAVAGMRFLTADEAAKYADFAIIFGTTNGKVSYLDPWNPNSTEVLVDDRTYYYFDQGSSTTGTSNTFDTTATIAKGGTLDWAGLHISAEAGNVAWNQNANALNMKSGAFISFDVAAGTLVSVTSYPGYNHFTINGIGTSADTLNVYFAEATTVTVASIGDLYLYNIIINPDEEAPAVPTLNEIKVSGMVVDYLVGEEISLEGVSVNAYYSDNSVRPIQYTVDTSAVNNAVAGEYTVVFTAGGETINVTVKYVSDFVISESTTIDLSATGASIQGTVGNYKGLTINATNGKFADNGSGWTQVNNGTVITFNVAGEAEVSVTAYSSADNFTITVVDGVCTITATANDYLKAIAVKIIRVFDESTTIDLSATGASIQGKTGEYGGLSIDATNGKFADNGSGWVQVNTGTIISLNVVEGAEVSVTAYSNAANFDIVISGGVCTITATANDYLKAITIKYSVVYKDTTIDLSATGANIQGTTGTYEGLSVDATNGKFADNNGGWVQVNAGTIITLEVAENSKVTVTAYSSAENFTIAIADGVCTITATANDYLKAITIETVEEPKEATYVLDATADLTAFAKGDKTDGETEVIGGFFTLHYSANTKIDSSNKTWEDGYSATQRINFGGKMQVGSTTKQCLEFTVTSGAVVKVWWVSGGDDRPMTIWDGSKNVIAQDTTSVKDGIYISTLVIPGAGTYYLGGDVNNNYIFKVEVTVGGTVTPPAHECESVCATCNKCLDAACEETACAEKCEGHTEAPKEVTYVLDATADLTAFAKGTKTDGETEVLKGFFTMHYSANTKIDSSNKTWEDGYSATQRINFGGKMQVGSTTKQCVEFTVAAGATVKVWWVSGGDDRPMTILDGSKNVVAQDTTSVKDGIYISTLTISEAGTYYLGGDVNNNYIFKIEVTTTE